MTLQEYINQEHPVRRPRVELAEGEYIVTNTIHGKEGVTKTMRHISIPAIWETFGVDGWVQIGDMETLGATDKHGNPIALSVFYIPTKTTKTP